MRWYGIITLFPQMFEALQHGVIARAGALGVKLNVYQLRDFAAPPHYQVDDRPYGGGPGMVLKAEPLLAAIQHAKAQAPGPCKVIALSPSGKQVKQAALRSLSEEPGIIFVCGRYEGIDQRVLDTVVDEEWSIGDYILSGGELPAMVMLDGILRLLPGVLGNADSVVQESFEQGTLDYPHYTRPAVVAGLEVPALLQTGHHAKITAWREGKAWDKTRSERPDLLELGVE